MNDEKIIASILAGNKVLYSLLYKRYAPLVWHTSLRICKRKDLAEDALQEGFVNAYKSLHQFQGKSSFKTWLTRIVLREALKIANKEKEFLFFENDDHTPHLEDEVGSEVEWKSLKTEEIKNAMKELKENQSIALDLFYLRGLDIAEIAESTDFTEVNVKQLLSRARKNIINKLVCKTK